MLLFSYIYRAIHVDFSVAFRNRERPHNQNVTISGPRLKGRALGYGARKICAIISLSISRKLSAKLSRREMTFKPAGGRNMQRSFQRSSIRAALAAPISRYLRPRIVSGSSSSSRVPKLLTIKILQAASRIFLFKKISDFTLAPEYNLAPRSHGITSEIRNNIFPLVATIFFSSNDQIFCFGIYFFNVKKKYEKDTSEHPATILGWKKNICR